MQCSACTRVLDIDDARGFAGYSVMVVGGKDGDAAQHLLLRRMLCDGIGPPAAECPLRPSSQARLD
jgi:hypothetical protein